MNQTQKCILYLAKEFRRICEKNNIEYSLIGGSMIGAVRHKGFIPWDDDMDVALLRKDYEAFLNACEKDLDNTRFILETGENEALYPFSFAKLILKGTYCEEDFSQGVSVKKGIWLDVFPLDNCPSKNWKMSYFFMINKILKNLVWVKCGYGTSAHRKEIQYKVNKLLGLPFSVDFLKRKRKNFITSLNGQATQRVFLSDYPFIVFYEKWFDHLIEYDFEGEKFSGFEDFDDYLSGHYGDYMRIPPPNQRNAHSLKNVDYGPYKDIPFVFGKENRER